MRKLTKLTYLNLSNNAVTDTSVLLTLTNLTTLSLSGNKVEKSQIDALKAALPNCKIYS